MVTWVTEGCKGWQGGAVGFKWKEQLSSLYKVMSYVQPGEVSFAFTVIRA